MAILSIASGRDRDGVSEDLSYQIEMTIYAPLSDPVPRLERFFQSFSRARAGFLEMNRPFPDLNLFSEGGSDPQR